MMSERPVAWQQGLPDTAENAYVTRLGSRIALALTILAYVAVTFASASRRLWFDELFTYYIAKAPTIGQLFRNIQLDLNPPLSYLAVRTSLTLFGDSELATRIPFMAGFLVGSLCLYRFVSRRLRPAYGLLAMLVFWSTPFLSYATEARPYALVIAFFGMAMLAWDRATLLDHSKISIVLLGLAILGMMSSHFFAVFYILPFCMAELWRSYRSRKLDWGIWAALLVPGIVPVAYLSRARAYESMALPPVQQASPFKAFAFFYHTLEPEGIILLLAVMLGMVIVFRRERQGVDRSLLMRPIDVVFTVGLLLIPIVTNIVLAQTHSAFFSRYGIPALFAYGLLITYFVAMYTNMNRLAAAAASFVLLAGICGTTVVSAMLNTFRTWSKTTARVVQAPPLDLVRPDLPLVAASGLTFLEMDRYESPATVARLYYLSDRDLALRYAHATIFEGGFATLNRHFPIRARVVPYRQFVVSHSHFLVVGTPDYQEDWLLRRLLDIHVKLEYLGNFPIPYKDTQIFEVAMPHT